jgi:hypothetical protein
MGDPDLMIVEEKNLLGFPLLTFGYEYTPSRTPEAWP